MMMFDKLWMKTSQSIALIDEEVPRLQLDKEKVMMDTIRIFVMETRRDLSNLDASLQYIEGYITKKPEWFQFDREISE